MGYWCAHGLFGEEEFKTSCRSTMHLLSDQTKSDFKQNLIRLHGDEPELIVSGEQVLIH